MMDIPYVYLCFWCCLPPQYCTLPSLFHAVIAQPFSVSLRRNSPLNPPPLISSLNAHSSFNKQLPTFANKHALPPPLCPPPDEHNSSWEKPPHQHQNTTQANTTHKDDDIFSTPLTSPPTPRTFPFLIFHFTITPIFSYKLSNFIKGNVVILVAFVFGQFSVFLQNQHLFLIKKTLLSWAF